MDSHADISLVYSRFICMYIFMYFLFVEILVMLTAVLYNWMLLSDFIYSGWMFLLSRLLIIKQTLARLDWFPSMLGESFSALRRALFFRISRIRTNDGKEPIDPVYCPFIRGGTPPYSSPHRSLFLSFSPCYSSYCWFSSCGKKYMCLYCFRC